MNQIKSICVNCGSSPGLLPEYIESAKALGQSFAENDIALVYGGANVGLMGAVADGALENGGRAIGVIPESIADKVAHPNLTELHLTASMHERKNMMFELSDAFIGLPGGMGTFEEIFEILTWAQLGFHGKACGVLNICGYYDKLLEFMDYTVEQRFVKQIHRDMMLVDREPQGLLTKLFEYRAPKVDKWIDRK